MIILYQNIKIDCENGIGQIKINRPEVRNALNAETLKELVTALQTFEENPDVKVIVLTGEGEKAFAAGADIKQLSERKMLDSLKSFTQTAFKKLEGSNKVTIAAINGYALGGGCELALACDIRIAVENAKIGLPELNLAIIPGAGGTQRLARTIGKGRAMEMILTGKLIDGTEAERIGLVSLAVKKEELGEAVQTMANSIKSKGPVALHLAKMVVNKGYDIDMETALMLETFAQTIAFGTEDKKEGTSAFLEKRSPHFQNR